MALDPKQFARQWNREIEAEARLLAGEHDAGRWKLVLWTAFELVWCAVLVALVLWLKRLEW
jgi:hypothetical protein